MPSTAGKPLSKSKRSQGLRTQAPAFVSRSERYYHWVSRTREQERPFVNREVALVFWRKLRQAFPDRVVAAVLMDNHFHLITRCYHPSLVRWKLGVELRSFSRIYRSYQKKGAPSLRWETIPDNYPITGLRELVAKIRYVHLNPCAAEMVNNPWLWEFSTLRDWEGVVADPWISQETYPKIFNKSWAFVREEVFRFTRAATAPVGVVGLPLGISYRSLSSEQLRELVLQYRRAPESGLSCRGPTRDTYLRLRLLRGDPVADTPSQLVKEVGGTPTRIRAWDKKVNRSPSTAHGFIKGMERLSGAGFFVRMPSRGSTRVEMNRPSLSSKGE